jgi:hypothetical protein
MSAPGNQTDDKSTSWGPERPGSNPNHSDSDTTNVIVVASNAIHFAARVSGTTSTASVPTSGKNMTVVVM